MSEGSMRGEPSSRTPKLLLAAAVLGLAGCGRACKTDHPYVPYAIGDGEAAGEDAALAATAEAGATELLATAAPSGASRWTLDGLELTATAGRVFVMGLARDLDGDGAKDGLAIVRPTQDDSAPDEVLFFKGGARGVDAPSTIVAGPAAPGADAGCARVARLAQVGRRSAMVELGASCPSSRGARWLGTLTFDRGVRLRFAATLLDPADAPKLQVEVDGTDRDGDGIDDVALKVTLDGPNAPFEPMPRAAARLAWLDRPAGLSRDSEEPEASLRALAQAAAARAGRAKEAAQVAGAVHQVRALYAAICAEAGVARFTKLSVGSGAIACGPSRALEESGFALARAHATLGDPARAAFALERAQLSPATKTAARQLEALGWLAQVAPAAQAKTLRAVAAVPQGERAATPSWGPLAFEATGKLLVRTAAGVARVDPETGDEAEAAGVAPWPAHVLGPDGTLRFLSVTAACDGGPLRAAFGATGPAQGEGSREVLLPIASPLGARCTQGGGDRGEPAPVSALAWGPRGLEALVAGEPVLFAPDLARASLAAAALEQPGALGGARSPNGKVTVLPTSLGIIVRAGKARMLRAKELEGGYGELSACAVSDDASRVACVRGGRALVGTWDAP